MAPATQAGALERSVRQDQAPEVVQKLFSREIEQVVKRLYGSDVGGRADQRPCLGTRKEAA